MYHYKAFNLHFITPFEFSELIEIDENENLLDRVIVKKAVLPEKLDNITNWGITFTSNENEFLLNTKADVKFLIRNGKEIIIDIGKECSEGQMRLLFLGSVIAALFMQRNMLVLHASAIKTPKGAVLFCGHSGAGKSTTSEALSQEYKKLSDDIVVLYFDEKDKKIKCIPSYPQSKLWEDSTNILDIKTNDLKHVHNRLNKFALPIKNNFCDEITVLDKIYILNIHNKNDIEIDNVNKLKTIVEIDNQIYRKKFYKDSEYKKEYFNLFVKISNQADIKYITRPYTKDSLNKLKELLLKDLNE